MSCTAPPVAAAPVSSRPSMVIAAGSYPGLINRNRLAWVTSAAALKIGTWYRYPAPDPAPAPAPAATPARTVSCIALSVPSAART